MAAHPPVRMSCVGPGVNMVGVFSEGTGLGAAGRSTLDVLERRGLPHVVADIDWGGHAVEPVPDTITRLSSLHAMPHSTTVVQMNPDMFGMFVLRYHRRLRYDMMPSVNAIVPFWELPALPAKWLPILRSFDVVLAPSRFVREAVESSMPARSRPLVWEYPQSVTPPEAVAPDRSRWLGDRSDRITFLSTFDIWSDIERKNPWAAIGAFQRAFAGRDDVSLVLKVNHARSHTHSEQLARLESVVSEDHRILLMTDFVSREDLWSLYASVDAYISLHRAEGLGLGLMEAMTVGKPVVATAWSGNMDFMNDSNSVPVPFRLVPVSDTTHGNYTPESSQEWAEPDVDAAAEALRALADDSALLTRLGVQGARDMRRRFERQAEPGVFDALVELADSGAAGSSEHRSRVRAARRLSLVLAAKPPVVSALRALKLKAPAPEGEQKAPSPTLLG